MEMILFKEDNDIYRIRKEECGCSIFSNQLYIEGDDMLFYILKKINEIGVEQAIVSFENDFDVDNGVIKSNLLDMCNNFEENKLFLRLVENVRDYYTKRSEESMI